MAQYCYGEYVRIEISSGSVDPVSVWVRVEHSDDQHRLVYGTVDDQTSNRWGRAFSSGSKLGASYQRVRERRAPLESSS